MNSIYLSFTGCLTLNKKYKATTNISVSSNSESQSSDQEKSNTKTKTKCRSVAKYVRGAPSKFRRVLDTIRGLKYEEALMILEYMPYRSCEPILKCLLSSASNAKNNFGMSKTNLRIDETYCDMGPVLKRYRPRAQGRGYKIKKPLSHITISVTDK
jgi:large subunit ribosomal protein L22